MQHRRSRSARLLSPEEFDQFTRRRPVSETWELVAGLPVQRPDHTTHRLIRENIARMIEGVIYAFELPFALKPDPVVGDPAETGIVSVPCLGGFKTDSTSAVAFIVDVLDRREFFILPEGRRWPEVKIRTALRFASCRTAVVALDWKATVIVADRDESGLKVKHFRRNEYFPIHALGADFAVNDIYAGTYLAEQNPANRTPSLTLRDLLERGG